MKYRVIVTPEAQANIDSALQYISERSSIHAARWLAGINKQIKGLEFMPRRFGEAREQKHFPEEIRQVVYASHRIIYTVDDASKTVHILFVRHAAMREIDPNRQDD